MSEGQERVMPRPEWGNGGGDHDQPYKFGLPPDFYLSTKEYARLLAKFPRRDQERQ